MGTRWNYGVGTVALLLALSPLVLAQNSSKPSTATAGTKVSESYDPHDFSGIWNPDPKMQPKGEVNPLDLGGDPHPLPPFSAEGEAKYLANKKFIAAGDVLDCDPFGTARNFFTPRPFEMIKAKDRLVQHYEYFDNWREIWTDGRSFPDDIDPDFMGYSIGHWEGDTFVVESKFYNGKQFLTWQGFPLSESMDQTERWQRIDYDTLKIVFTFNDPKMYAKPWNITFFWKLKPDWQLDAHPCTLSEIKEWDQKMGHVDKLPGLDYDKQRK
jgi:hypothetical protein